MSYSVNIQIANNQKRFTVGDSICGVVQVTAPLDTSLSNLTLSFHCIGQVRWIEYIGLPLYTNSHVYYDKLDYHEEVLPLAEPTVIVVPEENNKKFVIPFTFIIPKDKNLPSSMVSADGFVKYFVRFTIRQLDKDNKLKIFSKHLIVFSPIEKDLLISVGGSAEKRVLLHHGSVSMHSSIGRKGFAPGEAIAVHVTVDNTTNTSVTPRINLSQVQIYMCGERHKTIEAHISKEPIVGNAVAAHSQSQQLLTVTIPDDDSLSIKSSMITVKYFVQVTLEIPHSFDLHLNLPVVITSKNAFDLLQLEK